MALETAVHRWDAEQAAGHLSPIDPELAADGIDEALHIYKALQVARSDVPTPAGSLHLHATDAAGEWTLRGEDGGPVVEGATTRATPRSAARPRACCCCAGAAPAPRGDALEVFGDRATFDAWMAYGMP